MPNPENTNQHFSIETNQPIENKYVLHRRFDRLGRLVGDPGMELLMRSHVMVLGLGGVGSWAAESLARSGVGQLTVVDFDEICITNANRQLHALQGLVGKKKAEIMGERLRKINPQANVTAIANFYNAETSDQILAAKPDYIIDAIDNLTAKCHLLATCRDHKIPVITCGGSGARLDPGLIRVADMALTHGDPMLQQVRKILRQKHGFPAKATGKMTVKPEEFNIPCVYSEEAPLMPVELHYDGGQGFKCVCPQGQNDYHSCDKRSRIWGTASFVTGSFGLHMASWVVRKIIEPVIRQEREVVIDNEDESECLNKE